MSPEALGAQPDISFPAKALVTQPMSGASDPHIGPSISSVTVMQADPSPDSETASEAVL